MVSMEMNVVVAFLVYGACFILYHHVYLYLTGRRPSLTKKGRINECSSSWLEKSIEEDQYLLVVHQVRNIIMSITFLASTSVLLIGFLLAYVLVKVPGPNEFLLIESVDYPGWLTFFTLTYSFLNLILALRHLNNLTVLIRSDAEKLENIENKSALEYLEKLYMKGSQCYMLGRRGFLYAIIVLFWYVNVWVFVALILLLTVTLSYQHDF